MMADEAISAEFRWCCVRYGLVGDRDGNRKLEI